MRKEHAPIVIPIVSLYALFLLISKTETGQSLFSFFYSLFHKYPIIFWGIMVFLLIFGLIKLTAWVKKQYISEKNTFLKEESNEIEESENFEKGLFEGLLLRNGEVYHETYLGKIISLLLFLLTTVLVLFFTDQNFIAQFLPAVLKIPKVAYYGMTVIFLFITCFPSLFIFFMITNLISRALRRRLKN